MLKNAVFWIFWLIFCSSLLKYTYYYNYRSHISLQVVKLAKLAGVQILIFPTVQRAYYQQQLWVQAPFTDATSILNADAYGFVRKGSLLVPEMVISKPEGLPDPCSCGKCAHKNGCPCRVAGIRCCKYCKCKGGNSCNNSITE